MTSISVQLVFDNQGEAGYPPARLAVLPGSRILEINPVTKQIVWQYSGMDSNGPPWTLYSAFIIPFIPGVR
jgi:hypothetical protein